MAQRRALKEVNAILPQSVTGVGGVAGRGHGRAPLSAVGDQEATAVVVPPDLGTRNSGVRAAL